MDGWIYAYFNMTVALEIDLIDITVCGKLQRAVCLVCRYFPHFFQTNPGMEVQLRRNGFLPDPFQLITLNRTVLHFDAK
jgi:hypothetical protein